MKEIKYLELKDITALYGGEVEAAVSRVAASGHYLYGPETTAFEHEYADFTGCRHAVGCGNGLDAITLILKAYIELGRLEEGDGIIVPGHTFFATVLAVLRCGLRPVFADPDVVTATVGLEETARLMTSGVKGVIAVHLFGRNAIPDGLVELCRGRGVLLIEDNAQAHGCHSGAKRTGSLGDAAAHSFYPAKNLGALGDGGAVTTDDGILAATIRRIANYGSERKYEYGSLGLNSRLDEIQAAVLRVKLRRLDEFNDRRVGLARIYRDSVSNPMVRLLPQMKEGEDVCHVFPIFASNRDALRSYLADRGIGTNMHYPVPPHRQECLKQYSGLHLPNTDLIAETELSLPISPCLVEEDIRRVAECINNWNGGFGNS